MFRLLKLISSFRNTLLLGFLLLLSFLMVIQYNDQQKHIMGDTILEFSGRLHKQQNKILAIMHLPDQNDSLISLTESLKLEKDSLVEEMKALQSQLNADSIEHPLKIDSLISEEKFEYIPCFAIQNTIHKSYNRIVIDKGRKHGIKEGMGLVSPSGIAGRVVEVSEHFSLALSALNLSFKLSAMVEGQEYTGTGVYEWAEGSYEYGYIGALPLDAAGQIKVGDRVVTSGVSTVFPRGYLIGKVAETENLAQDGFLRIKIELATDFNRLYNLFAINALHFEEIDSLHQRLRLNE